jgi:hypothetical protein
MTTKERRSPWNRSRCLHIVAMLACASSGSIARGEVICNSSAGDNAAGKCAVCLQLNHLMGPIELCIEEVQAAALTQKGIRKRRGLKTNSRSPAPHQLASCEFELDIMEFNPIPHSTPFERVSFAPKNDAKRLGNRHGE